MNPFNWKPKFRPLPLRHTFQADEGIFITFVYTPAEPPNYDINCPYPGAPATTEVVGISRVVAGPDGYAVDLFNELCGPAWVDLMEWAEKQLNDWLADNLNELLEGRQADEDAYYERTLEDREY